MEGLVAVACSVSLWDGVAPRCLHITCRISRNTAVTMLFPRTDEDEATPSPSGLLALDCLLSLSAGVTTFFAHARADSSPTVILLDAPEQSDLVFPFGGPSQPYIASSNRSDSAHSY